MMRRTLLSGLSVVTGYFLLLILLAAVTVAGRISLTQGEGLFIFPSYWAFFIWGYYYLAPFAAALAFAIWKGRNWRLGLLLAAAIFAVHGAISLVAGGLRAFYLADWRQETALAEQAEIIPSDFSHSFLDENEDGLTDSIVISGNLTASTLPPARYRILVLLSQSGNGAVSQIVAEYDVVFQAPHSTRQEIGFDINPRRLKDKTALGPFSIELEISKWRELNLYGERVLMFCAWSLWCPTRRDGTDPEIYPDLHSIARLPNLDSFTLSPDQIQRPQFIFNGYSSDYGRDLDGNGLLDELVIALNVDSLWAGELFFQSNLSVSGAALNYETVVDKGVGIVELVIDGAEIRASGQDGPYRLESPIIFNNTPYCPGGTCANKNQPMFSVATPDYTTGPYRAADFE